MCFSRNHLLYVILAFPFQKIIDVLQIQSLSLAGGSGGGDNRGVIVCSESGGGRDLLPIGENVVWKLEQGCDWFHSPNAGLLYYHYCY